eukprot:comp16902_c1_seq2/m.15437 comp16902_c1_seq2/g.15437  ORF comp16902_c1_seq2/g.15437 comp16902_c1_seq2/m.15437 type:complete len:377 (-) comp16902_c1_seq2:296-1426(-)
MDSSRRSSFNFDDSTNEEHENGGAGAEQASGNSKEKPSCSFPTLIARAIMLQGGSTTLAGIYNYFIETHPYFKTSPANWRNRVRHTLTVSKCFTRIPCGNRRRGGLWTIHPEYTDSFLPDGTFVGRRGGHAAAQAAAAAAAAVSVPVVEVVERAAPTIPTVAEAPTPTPATTDLEIAKAASVGGTLALGAGAGDDKVSTTAIKSENFSTLGEENMLPAHAAEGTGDHATRGGPGADHGLAEGHVIAGAKHTAVHSQEETTELQSLRSKAEQLGIPHEVSENLEISELKELVTRMEEMNAVLHEESALLKEQELKLKRETLTRDIERWGEANRELEGEVGELDNHIRELHRRLVESGNDDLLDEQAKIEWGSVKSTA